MTNEQKKFIKNAVSKNIHFIVNKNFKNYRIFILKCIKNNSNFTNEMVNNLYHIQYQNL
jgi:hypothetical protein